MNNYQYDIYDSLPEQFNLVEYLFDQIQNDQATAFIQSDASISYSQLIFQVKQYAYHLKELGVEQESRVALLLPDCLEFVHAYLAIMWLGAVAVIVNESYADQDIEYVLKDCRAKLIFSRSHWIDRLDKDLVDSLKWILMDAHSLSESKIVEKPTHVAREAEAFWVYTSGSTGRPKGVIHSHYNPVVAIQTYGKHVLKLSPNDIVLSAPPMAFSYGLGTSVYFPIFSNATVVMTDDTSPFEYIQLINKHCVTVFFGIPHTYASIFAVREILPLTSKSLRLCISAGEQLPITTWENWRDHFGVPICEGIGTTESTHIFISNTSEATVPGSSGKAVPGYSIRLIDDAGNEVQGDNATGLLEVTGEGFSRGYWNNLKACHRLLRGQTMMTGDLYRVDKQDNYYFIGRKDNLVKIKGMWIAPIEIEQVFMQHPLVLESAVIVEPGIIENTVEIVAYLKLKDQAELTRTLRNQILSIANEHLPKFKIPRKIFALNDFPRTATGKIHRNKLRETV